MSIQLLALLSIAILFDLEIFYLIEGLEEEKRLSETGFFDFDINEWIWKLALTSLIGS